MQKPRVPTLIAWGFCAVVSVLAIIDTVQTVSVTNFAGRTFEAGYSIVEGLLVMLFAIPAALIISHHPRNVIGWLLMIPVLVAVIVEGVDRYLATFKTPPPADAFHLLLVLFSGASWVALIFPLLVIPLLFPTGRPPTPRWNWVVYLAIGMCLLFFFWVGFSPTYELENVPWTLTNPVGFLSPGFENYFMPLWGILLVVLTVTSLASIFFRYRRASLVEREQIKWLLYGFAVFVLVYIPSIYLNLESNFSLMGDIFSLLFILSILTIPISVTIAILRYRLFDIDVIIRLTLVYAVVTALLVAVYVAGIVVTQAAFRAVTGQTSDVAVLVTTLAITVLFNPVRRQVQKGIDRRFYRQKYDAVQALAEFASAARGGSDLDALTGMLVGTISKTLQPTQVGLYMKGVGKEEIGKG